MPSPTAAAFSFPARGGGRPVQTIHDVRADGPLAVLHAAVAADASVCVLGVEPAWCDSTDPLRLLSPFERGQLDGFAVIARRRSFVAGRWAAKAAVASRIPELAPRSIEIFNSPAFETRGQPLVRTLDGERLGCVSISHCLPLAAAAFSTKTPLGVDVEAVELRSQSFRQAAFTAREVAWIGRASAATQPVLETLLWCAKESMSKLLGVGLSVPLEHLGCDLDALDAQTVAAELAMPEGRVSFLGTILTSQPPTTCRVQGRPLFHRSQPYILSLATPAEPATELDPTMPSTSILGASR